MAHLLGSEFILAHLRSDVLDLQATLKDILARTSRCAVMSWKFPDRFAADIDVPALLEQYEFSEDVEANQVAHIVLLELVIDRFFLLSHCLTRFLDSAIAASQGCQPAPPAATTSVGITVLKHWNKAVQVASVLHQMAADLRMNRKKTREAEAEAEDARRGSVSSLGSLSASVGSLRSLVGPSRPPLPPVASGRSSDAAASTTTTPMGVQTAETAFASCSRCGDAGEALREAATQVDALCRARGLPCGVARLLATAPGPPRDPLDAPELARWRAELRKDLQRLQRHLAAADEAAEGLRAELKAAERREDEMRRREEEDTAAREEEAARARRAVREAEARLRAAGEERQSAQRVWTEEKTRLEEARDKREAQVKKLEKEEEARMRQRDVLGRVRAALEEAVADGDLAGRVADLRSRVADLEEERKTQEEALTAESAKAASLGKHVQTLQTKQERLLLRVSELTSRSEELQERVDQAEDEADELQEQVKSLRSENLQQQMELKEQKLLIEKVTEGREALLQKIMALERSLKEAEASTEKVKQEQRLLIEYPDLNGPVAPEPRDGASVMEQMEAQVVANETRIRLLGEQTEHLRATLDRLSALESARRPDIAAPVREDSPERLPQAWQEPPPPQLQPQPQAPAGRETQVRLWQLPPRPDPVPVARPSSRQNGQRPPPSRPSSAASSGPSSVRVYRQGRRSESPSGAAQSATGRTSPLVQWSHGSHPPRKAPTFVCQRCGRQYKSKSELAMHSAYCGRG